MPHHSLPCRSDKRARYSRRSHRSLLLRAALGVLGTTGLLAVTPAHAATAVSAPGYSGTFSALQYNIAGLPFANPDQNPNANTPYIAKLVNNYDIVNVQEDFAKNHDVLYAGSQHSFKSDRGGRATSFFQNDGLNTLTNFATVPVDPAKPGKIERVGFTNCGGDPIECLAGKGFSITRLDMGGGAFLDVYNTHTVAGDSAKVLAARGDNIRQLSDFMKVYSKDNAVLLMADSNARYTRGTDDLRYLLGQNGLHDPWVDLVMGGTAPAAGAPAMVCQPKSTPNPNPAACEVVDKILYRGSSRLQLDALSYQLGDPAFVNPKDGKPLSDHYPVSTRFGYNTLVSGVPEPASWALMIVGFGMAGASLRSRPRGSRTRRTAHAG